VRPGAPRHEDDADDARDWAESAETFSTVGVSNGIASRGSNSERATELPARDGLPILARAMLARLRGQFCHVILIWCLVGRQWCSGRDAARVARAQLSGETTRDEMVSSRPRAVNRLRVARCGLILPD
jgi:hypothetical protein